MRIKLIFLFLWSSLEALLFGFTFWKFAKAKEFSIARRLMGKFSLPLARASAKCISLNAAVILIPTCRALTSRIYTTFPRFFRILPSNNHAHFIFATHLIAFSMLHILAHMANFTHLSRVTFPKVSLSKVLWGSGAGITGIFMVLSFFLLVVHANSRLKAQYFELFQWSHWIWPAFLLLGSFHGAFCEIRRDFPPRCLFPQFFIWWLPAAIAIWGIERILRLKMRAKPSLIKRAILHPSQVLELQFLMPQSWNYAPGQFVYLKIPSISPWEWHPFSITSINSGELSLHIRLSSGDWSRKLGNLFGVSQSEGNCCLLVDVPLEFPQAQIEGPYGAFFGEIYSFSILVLFAAGIGQTPFVSLLKFLKVKSQEVSFHWKKVYFFVIGREPSAFEWFHSELVQLEKQSPSLFCIQTLLTGASIQDKESIYAIAINDLENDTADALTGLSKGTCYGKPNLECWVRDLSAIHATLEMGVYFCGPAALGKKLENAVERRKNMHFFAESF